MYHPPNQAHLSVEFFDFADKNSIFLGDLNAKHSSWGCSTNNNRGCDLLDAADDRAFIFLNNGSPTHTSFSYGTSEALDISLVSPELHPHCDWTILDSIGSDHLPILINVQSSINLKSMEPQRKFWNFKRADWDYFTLLTEKALGTRTLTDDLEEWFTIKQAIIHASHQSIPRGNFRHLKSFFQHNDPELRALILKRNILHRTLSVSGRTDDKVELKRLNAAIKQLYINHKRKAWNSLCSNIDARTPNTKLWRLAKSVGHIQSQSVTCNTVLTPDGKISPDDRAAANILGDYYKEMSKLTFNKNDVTVKNNSKRMIHNCRTSSTGNPVFMDNFSLNEFNAALIAMDVNKSPGPDGIHGSMIGHLGPLGKQRLLDFFNLSWRLGRLPREWKRAFVVPILKPGKDASSPGSFRPIALTSFVCKLMERLVLARLKLHLNIGDLLPKEQYGYRKGHSTIDQILFFCQNVRDAQNMKPTNHTAAVLLDMSRAFDTIW